MSESEGGCFCVGINVGGSDVGYRMGDDVMLCYVM
jgi:hypothetical protein